METSATPLRAQKLIALRVAWNSVNGIGLYTAWWSIYWI